MKKYLLTGCLVAGLLRPASIAAEASAAERSPVASTIKAALQEVPGVRKAAHIESRGDAQRSVEPVTPPPSSVVHAGGLASGGKPPIPPISEAAGSIRPVRGLSGITAPKIQNLEAALLMKRNPSAPAAPIDRKAKAAAAGLISGPGNKVDAKGAKHSDGRGGFQEFEKLDTSGS